MGFSPLSLNYLVKDQIMISGVTLEAVMMVFTLISMVCFVFAIFSTGLIVAELIISSPAISSRGLDAAFIRVIAQSTSILISIVLIFNMLSQLGFSPTTLLAGASVTGLAFALAAQTMLKNFFASVTLLMERPFREGDRIQIGTDKGLAEVIGLHTSPQRKPGLSAQRGDRARPDREHLSPSAHPLRTHPRSHLRHVL